MLKTLIKKPDINKLNKDIEQFWQVHPVKDDMHIDFEGVGRMVMFDRYSFKDLGNKTLGRGDMVVVTVKPDAQYPVRGIGIVQEVYDNGEVDVWIQEDYQTHLVGKEAEGNGVIKRTVNVIDKPLELYWEQIAHRVANAQAKMENEDKRDHWEDRFKEAIGTKKYVPAGRILFGSNSDAESTLYNCFILPNPQDSREGLATHRGIGAEIMSRGGGIGYSGSALRPKNVLAKGVNGRSSGSVSWLADHANLTHLIQQGGSRRGAQMQQQLDSHPDVIEFIVAKIQNANILQYIAENFDDEVIKEEAGKRIKFVPITAKEKAILEIMVQYENMPGHGGFTLEQIKDAKEQLSKGGKYKVENDQMMTGANISVAITDDFMEAVENNEMWTLRYPDVDNYTEQEMKEYNEEYHKLADPRDWEAKGYAIRDYHQLPARELWELITFSATYSGEPGLFFIDRANKMATSQAYGQKVVSTNPCGEQPLPAWSVCNLGAVNLAEHVDRDKKEFDFELLKETVKTAVRLQDNVVDASPYFFKQNESQAKGERRLGIGVMGLADALIYSEVRYGSKEGNNLADKIFETMAVTAWEESIKLAKEKGSFLFLQGETEEETMELRKKFVSTGFIQTMPDHIKEGILEHGVRNSAVLTVAPTGSTGTLMGVSTGLEPYFAFKYYRSGRLGQFLEVNQGIVQEYLDENPEVEEDNLPDFFVSAMELSPEEHVSVQTTIQRWVDSSISKTVNMPAGSTPKEVAEIYELLYKGGAKGGTIFVDGSRDTQVLTLTNEETDLEEQTVVLDNEEKAVTETVEVTEEDKRREYLQTLEIGVEAGNLCPVCQDGEVIKRGGCTECSNLSCGVQLKCD